MLRVPRLYNYLFFIIIIVNASAMFIPLLRNDDSVLYANIVKHMLEANDWINLFSSGHDWLDKPHFPFWISAISFKLLGTNSFAYMLPGFVFHLIGAYYTYRLARHLYSHECGVLAALIYLSSLHLLLSSIDVRAEAYLLGTIMAASYYWLLYDKDFAFKPLVLGSVFTALALMTKGPFVAVTIFSGLVFSWAYTGRLARVINWRWLLAYALCLLLIVPELLCLYLQFDAHPEKLVFGQHGVSGLAWFFWGSQFGRFFNQGPIVNHHGNPWFFMHTYLWAFLPWSLLFIAALLKVRRVWSIQKPAQRTRMVYLLSSFWVTFIMFSATSFQLDHYTNIIMPFAAILCATYLCSNEDLSKIILVQRILSLLLLVSSAGLIVFFFHHHLLCLYVIVPGLIVLSISREIYFTYRKPVSGAKYSPILLQRECVNWSVLSIASLFSVLMLINYVIYSPYDVGYNLANFINSQEKAPVYDYKVGWSPLEFHLKYPYTSINSLDNLPVQEKYYLVLPLNSLQDLTQNSSTQIIRKFCGNTIDIVLNKISNPQLKESQQVCYLVLLHQPKYGIIHD